MKSFIYCWCGRCGLDLGHRRITGCRSRYRGCTVQPSALFPREFNKPLGQRTRHVCRVGQMIMCLLWSYFRALVSDTSRTINCFILACCWHFIGHYVGVIGSLSPTYWENKSVGVGGGGGGAVQIIQSQKAMGTNNHHTFPKTYITLK